MPKKKDKIVDNILSVYYKKYFTVKKPEDEECISPDNLIQLFSSDTAESEKEKVFGHITKCKRCLNLVSVFSKIVDTDEKVETEPPEKVIKKIKSFYWRYIRELPKKVTVSISDKVIEAKKTDGEVIMPIKVGEYNETTVTWDYHGYFFESRFSIAKEEIINLRIGILKNNKYIAKVPFLLYQKPYKKAIKNVVTGKTLLPISQLEKGKYRLKFDYKHIPHQININFL